MTLADILSLRDSGLSEQEAWAVCLECSLSMRSVARAALFQTLCITPDTLAFNTSGNVCFMEQLSGEAGQRALQRVGAGLPPTQEGSDAPPSGRTAPLLPLWTHLPTLAGRAAVSAQGPGRRRGRGQKPVPETLGLGSVRPPPRLLPTGIVDT